MIVAATGHRFLVGSGERTWARTIKEVFFSLPELPAFVIAGDMVGIDPLITAFCAQEDIPCYTFATRWDEFGLRAPTVRNAAMIACLKGFRDGGHDVEVLVFSGSPASADGTANLIRQALRANIPVRTVSSHGRVNQLGSPERGIVEPLG